MKKSLNGKKQGSILKKIGALSAIMFLCLILNIILSVVMKNNDGAALLFWLNIIISVVVGVLGAINLMLIKKTIITPINAISEKTEDMSNGNISGNNIDVSTNDELGELAVAINKMAGYNQSIISDIKYTAEQIATQNLTVKPKADYAGDYIPIKNALESVVESMNGIVSDVESVAGEVKSNSSQMSVSSDALSRVAREETEIVNNLHSDLDSVHSSINESADKATEIKEMCENMVTAINDGNDKMASMLDAMEEINQTSSEIANIIKTIDDISFQTNILALNASIEAARAGEAGRGFAIVANEVSSLANMTAQAAKSTTGLIKKSLTAVSNGSNIADETAKILSDVIGMMESSSVAISNIADTSVQQADSIKNVVDNINRISATVNEINTSAEDCVASANALTTQSVMLYDTIDGFITDDKRERKLKAVSAPVKEIKLDNEPELKSAKSPSKPVTKPISKPITPSATEAKAQDKPKATTAKTEVKPTAKPISKPITPSATETKAQDKPKATTAKTEVKPTAKPISKPITPSATKTKVQDKPKAITAKTEAKPTAKPISKPITPSATEAKAQDKPKAATAKTEAKPTAKPIPKPATNLTNLSNSAKPKIITLDEDEEKAAKTDVKAEQPATKAVPKSKTEKPVTKPLTDTAKPQPKAETTPKPAPSRSINLDDDAGAPSTPAKVVTRATMQPVKHTINLEKEKY